MSVSLSPNLPVAPQTPSLARTALLGRLGAVLQRLRPHSGSAKRVGPIGLEVGLESLNLVQLCRSADGGVGLKASACLPYAVDRSALLASPAAFRACLTDALRGQAFVGRRVVSALPAGEVRLLPVPYETSGGRSDATAIALAVRDRLDGDLSGYVVDYMPVRSDAQATDRLALVAVARREAVIAYLELLRAAGLKVSALEIGPSAIQRLISSLADPARARNHLVINCGVTSSYLTVISGRRLLQDQSVEFGERAMLAQIGTALQATPEEARALVERYGLTPSRPGQTDADDEVARTLVEIVKPGLLRLVDEISRILIYTASETRGASVDNIHLMGSLARWPGIEGLLQSMLEIPVQALDDPLGLFKASGGTGDGRGQSLLIATGLALRGMGADE